MPVEDIFKKQYDLIPTHEERQKFVKEYFKLPVNLQIEVLKGQSNDGLERFKESLTKTLKNYDDKYSEGWYQMERVEKVKSEREEECINRGTYNSLAAKYLKNNSESFNQLASKIKADIKGAGHQLTNIEFAVEQGHLRFKALNENYAPAKKYNVEVNFKDVMRYASKQLANEQQTILTSRLQSYFSGQAVTPKDSATIKPRVR